MQQVLAMYRQGEGGHLFTLGDTVLFKYKCEWEILLNRLEFLSLQVISDCTACIATTYQDSLFYAR